MVGVAAESINLSAGLLSALLASTGWYARVAAESASQAYLPDYRCTALTAE